MIFNQSFLLGMNNRLYSQENGSNFQMLLHLFSGTPPTFAEYTTTKLSGSLNANGLDDMVHHHLLMDWCDGFGTELYNYFSPNDASLWTAIDVQTSEMDLSNSNTVFSHLAEGTATWFVLSQVFDQVTTTNYRSVAYENFYTAIGTVGNPGSGADLEISTTSITSDTPIIPSVFTFHHQ